MERASRNTIKVIRKDIYLEINDFLKKNGIIFGNNIREIGRGRNSQVYLIEQGRAKWIVKKYNRWINDDRKRLENEFNFLSFLTKKKVKQISEPIFYDIEKNIGLFSFIPGELPKSINSSLINQASDFIKIINKYRKDKSTKFLPEASEACFSINDHINLVTKKVRKLINIVPDNDNKNKVLVFAKSWLYKSLKEIRKDILIKYSERELKKTISFETRIISPSDFGFQNTLIEDNKLYFLDFEYAGWDDPAKLICDFGCYPDIPINHKQLKQFQNSFFSWLEDAESVIKRSEVLMPLHRLKWCCIMLNGFTLFGESTKNNNGMIFDYNNQFKKTKKYYEQFLV